MAGSLFLLPFAQLYPFALLLVTLPYTQLASSFLSITSLTPSSEIDSPSSHVIDVVVPLSPPPLPIRTLFFSSQSERALPARPPCRSDLNQRLPPLFMLGHIPVVPEFRIQSLTPPARGPNAATSDSSLCAILGPADTCRPQRFTPALPPKVLNGLPSGLPRPFTVSHFPSSYIPARAPARPSHVFSSHPDRVCTAVVQVAIALLVVHTVRRFFPVINFVAIIPSVHMAEAPESRAPTSAHAPPRQQPPSASNWPPPDRTSRHGEDKANVWDGRYRRGPLQAAPVDTTSNREAAVIRHDAIELKGIAMAPGDRRLPSAGAGDAMPFRRK